MAGWECAGGDAGWAVFQFSGVCSLDKGERVGVRADGVVVGKVTSMDISPSRVLM